MAEVVIQRSSPRPIVDVPTQGEIPISCNLTYRYLWI